VRKRDKARMTHEVLLDAAADEFARRGYAGANLKHIAVQIGMSKGALYAHFPSKNALAAALVAPFDQTWREILRQADEERPLCTLRRITFGLVSRLCEDIRFRAGLQLVSDEARAHGTVPAVVHDVTQAVVRLVREAQRQGQLPLTHAPEALSSLVIACTFGIYHTMPHRQPEGHSDDLDGIWQLFMSASTA
jgi:AcrR family transcriptional regulator